MKWTKELPTEPGWYWYRAFRSLDVKIVCVYRISGKLYVTHDCRHVLTEDFFSGEWYGPLIPPAVPEVN